MTVPISVRIDRESREPLAAQIYRGLREAILKGLLPPGKRLPSTRALARELRVSRNTVLHAFDQLLLEGYLEGKAGSGTRVARAIPEELLRARETPAVKRPPAPPRLSRIAREIARVPQHSSPYVGPSRPFRVGASALEEFPMDVWERLLKQRWARMSAAALDYGDPRGLPALRRAITEHIRNARGVNGEVEQVLVQSGSQQALDLASRVLLDPGDAAWLEDPGYPGARGALLGAGARVEPVPVDREGIDVAYGVRHFPGARVAYVTPSHQFPLAVTMSRKRRLDLLEWANRSGSFVLEDDYDSEFRHLHRPLGALQGLDAHGRVLYVGTFSKVLFPSLRLGFLVVPTSLVDAFRAVRYFADGQPPGLSQAVLAAFIEEGHFEKHIRRMRMVCAERQEALLDAARRHLAGLLDVERADGGMNLVGWLPDGVDDQRAAEAAARAGVEVIALSALSRRKLERPGLFLGYSAFRPEEIEEGARKLRGALETVARKRATSTSSR